MAASRYQQRGERQHVSHLCLISVAGESHLTSYLLSLLSLQCVLILPGHLDI